MNSLKTNSRKICIKTSEFIWARSPIRLDLQGGWTDTPPYTYLHGGMVVNLAADLNDFLPVQVHVRRAAEPYVRIYSMDQSASKTITDFDGLLSYHERDEFGMAKAAMVLLGITQQSTGCKSLKDFLLSLGGGMEISQLVAVPKGSGLGTSSILGAALLAGIRRFFDDRFSVAQSLKLLSNEALELEQMLSTGGGWQDQVGGIVPGVKCAINRPGKMLRLTWQDLSTSLFTRRLGHFNLYYTGVSRLAKNILADVVAKVREEDAAYLALHDQLRRGAAAMKDAILEQDLATVAKGMREYWELKKAIHPSATNQQVECLLDDVRGLYDAAVLTGAGGGGHALFLSVSPNKAARLRRRLQCRAGSNGTLEKRVDFSLNTRGLEVSVL